MTWSSQEPNWWYLKEQKPGRVSYNRASAMCVSKEPQLRGLHKTLVNQGEKRVLLFDADISTFETLRNSERL
jgi:hypothetical protein